MTDYTFVANGILQSYSNTGAYANVESVGIANSTDSFSLTIPTVAQKNSPHLLVENANQTRQAGAATESFRNEMVKASKTAFAPWLKLPKYKKKTKI